MSTITRFIPIATVMALLFIAQPVLSQKKFTDAVELNDYLITPNDSLYAKGQRLGEAVGKGYRTKEFSGVVPAKKAILLYATEKLAELKKVKDQFGSEEFRKGVMDFLEYEISLMKNKTQLLDSLNEKSTDEQIKAAIDEMIASSKDETEFLSKVQQMQVRFAEKNGFGIRVQEQ